MSYYAFTPHQVYPTAGFGSLGALEFNGASVWTDWKTGSVGCTGELQTKIGCDAARRAVDAIRAALGQLGYGQLDFGASWGSADVAAYNAWVADNGLSPSRGLPTEGHMAVMDKQVKAGQVTGPQPVVQYDKVGSEYVVSSDSAKAGIGIGMWYLIALGVVGAGVIYASRSNKSKRTRRPALASRPAYARR